MVQAGFGAVPNSIVVYPTDSMFTGFSKSSLLNGHKMMEQNGGLSIAGAGLMAYELAFDQTYNDITCECAKDLFSRAGAHTGV